MCLVKDKRNRRTNALCMPRCTPSSKRTLLMTARALLRRFTEFFSHRGGGEYFLNQEKYELLSVAADPISTQGPALLQDQIPMTSPLTQPAEWHQPLYSSRLALQTGDSWVHTGPSGSLKKGDPRLRVIGNGEWVSSRPDAVTTQTHTHLFFTFTFVPSLALSAPLTACPLLRRLRNMS